MKPFGHKSLRVLLSVPLILLAVACANMGRPTGGPRDETPPRFVSSNPMPGALNVDRQRITLLFDENIQLEDAFNKVVVSPGQKQPPQVSSNGRRVTVQLRDSLLDSTTYTIDFADAIKDLNEGNILDGFALDFSTGDHIDTLRISGIVLEARTLEPAQGMLVGVYANLDDSAVTTLPMERIARTNQLGQFTIRNLAPGEYKVFAINDLNRDYHWDRSEDVAFFDRTVVPTAEAITVTDTLYGNDGADSLAARAGVRFLPNDLLLTWFNQEYKPQYLGDYKRPERRRITVNLAAPPDSLPVLRIVDGAPGQGRPDSLWAMRHLNATADSLEYWIVDPDVLAADSLRLSLTYLKTDTTDTPVWTTDTLRFYFKDPKIDKKELKRRESLPTFRIDSITGDTIPLPPPDMEYLSIRALGHTIDLNRPLLLEASLPWTSLDTAGVRFSEMVDTVWNPVPFKIVPDSTDLLKRRRIDYSWVPGAKYKIEIDTLAANTPYNIWNRPFAQELTAAKEEDYSSLRFLIPGTDSLQLVVELLNGSDNPVAQAIKPVGQESVDLRYLRPGDYYARLYVDANLNGKWDTGNIPDKIQPEDVYYFAKKLSLKKNWDIEQTWMLDELAVDAQKPYAIKKNKPKLKRGETAPQDDEEEDFEDEQQRLRDPFTPSRRSNGRSNNRGLKTAH